MTDTEQIEKILLALLKGEFSSLKFDYNDHACSYMDAKQASEEGAFDNLQWISENEKETAISSNRVWRLQWYPDTPIGCYTVAASSLATLLKFVSSQPLASR